MERHLGAGVGPNVQLPSGSTYMVPVLVVQRSLPAVVLSVALE